MSSKTPAPVRHPGPGRTIPGIDGTGLRPGFRNLADNAVLHLGRWLKQQGYRFVTSTPATHGRVIARPGRAVAESLTDVFGWSRPFLPDLLPAPVLGWLEDGDIVESRDGLLRSKVRFSSLADSLYVHSAYPTVDDDSVFFGPDSYRFAALIQRTLAQSRANVDCIVDVGCGTGAGGIIAAQTLKNVAAKVILTDINAVALRYARINTRLAATANTSFRLGDLYEVIDEPVDVIVANPPYLLDPNARFYRHGGGELGSGLSTRIVLEGLAHLSARGMLILYTGAPIVEGRDPFWESITSAVQNPDFRFEYSELDPDVFGEELEMPAYSQVDRIAAVALVVTRCEPGPGIADPVTK